MGLINQRLFFLLLSVVLLSCNSENKVEISKSFSEAFFANEYDSLRIYLDDPFTVVFDGQEMSNGMLFLKQEMIAQEMIGAEYMDIGYEEVGENEIRVYYSVKSWPMQCFGIEFMRNIDTYFFEENKIVRLEKSSIGGNKIDSTFIKEQEKYYDWLDESKFSEEVFLNAGVDQEKYFYYLRLYCESKE